jgi:hypothetical protein
LNDLSFKVDNIKIAGEYNKIHTNCDYMLKTRRREPMVRKLFAVFAVVVAAIFLPLGIGCEEGDGGDDCCECTCYGTGCDTEPYVIYPDGEKCKKACADHCASYSCSLKSSDSC